MKKLYLILVMIFTLNVTGIGIAPDLGGGSSIPVSASNIGASTLVLDWREEANARIEKIRKTDAEVSVVDAQGLPVKDVSIQVKQIKHQFAFGASFNKNMITNQKYRDFVKNNFEWGVLENESKWYANEPGKGDITYDVADKIIEYCKRYGIKMRGHTLFWEDQRYVQQWVQDLSTTDLKTAVNNRINGAVNHFKDNFIHWDVNNELMHGHYFYRSKLGDSIVKYMFNKAKEVDPKAKLFINDYDIINGADVNGPKNLLDQTTQLVKDGAKIDGIGVQGHFWKLPDPAFIYNGLNMLSKANLPIWVTEYDYASADQNARADALEKLYRTAFSHASVEGILMWGFWGGSHWRGETAAIVNNDWTMNEAGTRYQALLNEWTTNLNGISDATGKFSFRGFHGTYDISVTSNDGKIVTKTFELEPGEDVQKFVLNVGDFTPTTPRPTIIDPEPTIYPDTPDGMVLVNDNFNNNTTGVKPNGWFALSSGGYQKVVGFPNLSDRCIEVESTSTDMSSAITNRFNPQTKKVVMETDVMVKEIVQRVDIDIESLYSNFVRVRLDGTGNIICKSAEGDLILQKYLPNTWYSLKVEADAETNKFSVYINGVRMAENRTFSGQVSMLDAFSIQARSFSTVYIDNVRIYTGLATPPVLLSGIKVSKTLITLTKGKTKGKTKALTAIYLPDNATNKGINWYSNNTKVATVNSSGLVRAKEKGNAIISVKAAEGGYVATCKVTVLQPVKSSTLSKKSIKIKQGKKYRLKAIINPANANNKKVRWKSSNRKLATVSVSGLVKGIKKGTLYIYTYTLDGNKRAKCKVTVY